MDDLSKRYLQSSVSARDYYLSLTRHSKRLQTDLLLRIISANKEAVFGREHGFPAIHSVEQFSRQVPVRSYSELTPWIDQAAGGGASVLTGQPPLLFHRTSGTTGVAKKIPVTRSGWQVRILNSPARWGALLKHHPEINDTTDAALSMTVNPPSAEITVGGIPWCFFSETNWSRVGFTRHPGGPGMRAPWSEIPAGTSDVTYYRLRLCLESPLRGILSWFPASLLHLANTIRARGPEIVKSVHDGAAIGGENRPPNHSRAAELEHLLSAGRAFTLHDVWPTLTVVECWKTAGSRLYVDQLRSCLGPEVDIFPAGYGSTESSIAFTLEPTIDAVLLDVTCAFFEFTPVDHPGDPPVLHYELERDRDYSVVVTTMSGLYRYALGDVVRVHDFVNGVPLIDFQHRDGVVSSLLAEKMTEPQIASAVAAVLRESGVGDEASVCPVYGAKPHYLLLLAARAELAPEEARHLAVTFDMTLSRNVNYAFHRAAGLIWPARIEVLPSGAFAEWRVQRCVSGHSSSPQQKHPLVLDSRHCDELRRVSDRLRGCEAI
jgi:hypothetical protein